MRYEFTTETNAPNWADWDGKDVNTSSLENGDDPLRYASLRITALENLDAEELGARTARSRNNIEL
jgi:hypothetical protein